MTPTMEDSSRSGRATAVEDESGDKMKEPRRGRSLHDRSIDAQQLKTAIPGLDLAYASLVVSISRWKRT